MVIFYIVRVGVSLKMHYVDCVGFSIIVYVNMLLCVLVICIRVTKCVSYYVPLCDMCIMYVMYCIYLSYIIILVYS